MSADESFTLEVEDNHGAETVSDLVFRAAQHRLEPADSTSVQGPDFSVNARTPKRKWSLLHACCWGGEDSLVNVLLEDTRTDPNARDVENRSPLALASLRGHADVVRALLADPRVDVNALDNIGRSALHLAVGAPGPEAASLLIADKRVHLLPEDWMTADEIPKKVKAPKAPKDTATPVGETSGGASGVEPLAAEGEAGVALQVVEAGSEKPVESGRTPLDYMHDRFHADDFPSSASHDAFIQFQADFRTLVDRSPHRATAPSREVRLAFLNKLKKSPFPLAEIQKDLADHPLLACVWLPPPPGFRKDRLSIFKSSEPDLALALHIAVWTHKDKSVPLIRAILASPHACPNSLTRSIQWSALHMAARKTYPKVVTALIAESGDRLAINAQDCDDMIPFHTACKNKEGHSIVRLLLDAPATDVNAISRVQIRGLHLALIAGDQDTIEMLLFDSRIDKFAEIDKGAGDLGEVTTLEFAAAYGQYDAFMFLRDSGVEVQDDDKLRAEQRSGARSTLFSLTFGFLQLSALPFVVGGINWESYKGLWGGAVPVAPVLQLSFDVFYGIRLALQILLVLAALFGFRYIHYTHSGHGPALIDSSVFRLRRSKFFLFLNHLIFSLLLVPIVRGFIEAFDCKKDDAGVWMFEHEDDIECWTGIHVLYMLMALAGGAVYVTALIRVTPLDNSIENLRRKRMGVRPDWYTVPVLFERWGNAGLEKRKISPSSINYMMPRLDSMAFISANAALSLFAVTVSVLLSSYPLLQLWTFVVVAVAQCVVIWVKPPYLDPWANAYTTSLATAGIVSNTIATFAGMADLEVENSEVLGDLAASPAFGWPMLVGSLVISFVVATKAKSMQPPASPLLERQAKMKAQSAQESEKTDEPGNPGAVELVVDA